MTLGVHAGIAYEGAHRSDDLHRRVVTLEQELHRTSARITEEERARLSRMLHDWMGQMLVGLKIDVHWVARQLRPRRRAFDQRHWRSSRVHPEAPRRDHRMGPHHRDRAAATGDGPARAGRRDRMASRGSSSGASESGVA